MIAYFSLFLSVNVETTFPNPDFLYPPNVTPIQRRGSVPCENLSAPNRNNCHNNNKAKSRKKILRRRSSGGAEILSPIAGEAEAGASTTTTTPSSTAWYRFKRSSDATKNRSDLDLLLSRRRGSLPVEVLTVCHSGKQHLII